MRAALAAGLVLGAALLLSAASEAPAQDVWIDGTLQLWTSAPKGKQPMFRYGRDSRVGFIALLPNDRALVWSYCMYDFPGPSGSRTDRFFYRAPLGKSGPTAQAGRFYSPFGSPDIPAYDKYVDTSDEAVTANPLLDAFGDGVGISYTSGRVETQLAVQNLAVQPDDRVDLFARGEWRRGKWFAGISLYSDTAAPDTRKEALACHATYRTPGCVLAGEYLTGKPLGERATAGYLGAQGQWGLWSAFASVTTYHPKAAPRGETRKVGVGYRVDPLTTVSLWHENHLRAPDRTTLSFETSLR